MKQQTLSQTNKFLLDPEKRRQALLRSVLSSSAVEGIKMTAQELVNLQQSATLQSGSAR
ncbi:MAG: hypothetical protein HIU83_03750 [Proteobacteria bacterium]|jgi:hypothetical protein|nr:hypothetical protein [Pseudomonadota bacterium]